MVKERRKEEKRERKKEGKRERRKERKRERRKEGKREEGKEGKRERGKEKMKNNATGSNGKLHQQSTYLLLNCFMMVPPSVRLVACLTSQSFCSIRKLHNNKYKNLDFFLSDRRYINIEHQWR